MGCSKDKFSCADGRCVSWTLTCNGEKNCEDGTDEPLFCKKQDELSVWEKQQQQAKKHSSAKRVDKFYAISSYEMKV